jgi:hypothetical protein
MAVVDPVNEYLDSLPPIEEGPEDGSDPVEDDRHAYASGDDEATGRGDGDDGAESLEDGAEGGPEDGVDEPSPYSDAWEKAELLDTLDQYFSTNDVEFVTRLIEQMPAERRDMLLNALGGVPGIGQVSGGYENPTSHPMEAMTRIPEVVGAHVNHHVGRLAPIIDASNVEVHLVRAELDAMRELLGLELPQVDRGQVMQMLQDGTMTYQQAVARTVGDAYRRAVVEYRQARKARPDTPGGSTEGLGMPRAGANGMVDAVDIFRQLYGDG